MDITLYNTLTRSKETFKPLQAGRVTMYHCGPTVYDTPHIGNYRTFVMNDVVRRVFEWNGYAVTQAMNITDVDDKTIRKSSQEGITLKELTSRYEALFIDGITSLNILAPHHLLRATEYIHAMISLIQSLVAKGAAYTTADGVYMSIEKVRSYGELAHLDLSKASDVRGRIASDEYDKADPHDFALWKFKTLADGSNSWSAPFGDGRPGWHIECSAMAMDALGPTIDIHTGGSDLIFPHHTNEIAQSETATEQQYVRYWIHGAFVNIASEKMAKSKGNFLKLEDLQEEAISPLAYRYWLLTAHYRSPVNFTFDAVRAAQNALIRLISWISETSEGGTPIQSALDTFKAAINNDLDMPAAIATLWETHKTSAHSPEDRRATILEMDKVLGLGLERVPKAPDADVPPEVELLAEAREAARQAKDWAKADALRKEISNRGYDILDTAQGYKVIEK